MKLTCEAVEDFYVLYQEDDLHISVKEAVDNHLDKCENCSNIYTTGDGFNSPKNMRINDESLKPSEKLDNQIKMKLKLRRMRFLLLLLATIIIVSSCFSYVGNRKILLYEVSSMESSIRDLYMQLGMAKWEGDIRFTTSEYIEEVNEKTTRLKRSLNIIENRRLKNYPYQLNLNFNLTNFINVLHVRFVNDNWTERDEEAFIRMEEYLDEITRLLTDERLKLNHVDNLHPSALFNSFDGKSLSKSFQQIDHLAYTYGNFQQFPEEISIMSRDEIVEKARDVFQAPDAEVTFNNVKNPVTVETYGIYTTTIETEKEKYYAKWEAYTGNIVEFDNYITTHSGELLEEAGVREQLIKNVAKLIGTDDFRVDYLGINYHYSSNMDDKLYSYHIIPSHEDYDTNAMYRLFVDARTGKMVNLISLEQDYYPRLSFSDTAINFSVDKGIEQLKQEAPSATFDYQQTIYVPSLLSNRYELTHTYEKTTKEGATSIVLLNVRTGKVEAIY